MKFSAIAGLSLIGVIIGLGMSGCENVPAGNVGVQVEKYGDDRGINVEVKGPGRYYTGWNTDMFLFPTFTQSVTWEKEKDEDQSIRFQDRDGSSLAVPVGLSYSISRENVVKVFQKYRRGVAEITDTYLRNMVRDAFNQQAAKYTADEIYGSKKAELLERVTADVKQRGAAVGITVEQVSLVGDIQLPPAIAQAVQGKIAAVQTALRKENELQSARADAEKEVAKARGEAEAARIRGDALSKNPQVLQQMTIEKWDGKLPVYLSDSKAAPFLQLK